MRVYRVERKKHLKNALKGTGAALTEGYRWNSLNTYLVYTAESRALATLEVSVHLDLSEDLPEDRFYVEIDIPDDIRILDTYSSGSDPSFRAFDPLEDSRRTMNYDIISV